MSARTFPLGLTASRLRLIAGVLFGLVVAAGVGTAVASWVTNDSSNNAVTVADSLPTGATPTAAVTGNSTTVDITFAQTSTAGGVAVTDYDITRYPAGGGAGTAVAASCTGTTSLLCSVASQPDGSWKYTDTPKLAGTSWTGAESDVSNAVTVDTTQPSVTINKAAGQADPTNVASPISFTVVFSEPVTGFATGDVTITNGGATGTATATVTGAGPTYNVAVTGLSGNGTITATIAAGVASDSAGNANTASTSTDNTVLLDTVAPTVTGVDSTIADGSYKAGVVIPITVTFTEPVIVTGTPQLTLETGASDAVVSYSSGSGTNVLTFDYTIAAGHTSSSLDYKGVSSLALNGGTIADAASNTANRTLASPGQPGSLASNSDIVVDTTAPTVTVNKAAGQGDPTNVTSPINFAVVFSETVTGFTDTDVTVTNGASGSPSVTVTGSGATYNIAITGLSGNGNVSASLAAGIATDAAGNGNTASTSSDNAVTLDTIAPTVTINQAVGQADPTNGTMSFTVVFSEVVTGFDAGNDLAITELLSGSPSVAITGSGTTYTVAITGLSGEGAVSAAVLASRATDAAGNGNVASTSTDNTINFDNVAPTVTIEKAAGQADPTNVTSPVNFTVVFSESVTGFNAGNDLSISKTASGTAVPAITGSGTTYNVAITGLSGNGTLTVSVLANRATDAAGNGNAASTSSDNTVTLDTTAPTVTINKAAGQADPTNVSSPISFTVVFSEAVANFATGDVTVSNGGTTGTATATVTGSGTTYTVAVTGLSGSGNVTASLAAGVASDAAGNTSAASTSTDNVVTVDTTAPTISSTTLNNHSGGTAGRIEQDDTIVVTFSERMAVASFCSAWSGDTSNQSLTGNGQVTVTLTDGGAGNDTLTVSSNQCTFNLGTIDLGSSGYTAATRTFGGSTGSTKSTLSWTASTFQLTINLGAASGSVGTVASSTPIFTLAAGVTDSVGNAVSNSPFTLAAGQKF